MVTFAQAQPGIFAGESGGDYNALFGYQNRPGGRFENTRLTDMAIEDVLRFTDPQGPYASYVRGEVGRTATPVGAYQVVGTTLRDAVNALDIDPSTPFNQATQDRIGEWIFSTQGTGAWEGYRGPQAGGQGMQMQPQMMQPQGFVEQDQQDPFDGLSRNQRMMLGFAALRDAAASLQGQNSSFFNDAFGGIQTRQMQQQQLDVRRQEQERLRRQGDLQNRIAMTNSLGELEQRISGYTMLGQQPPANLVQLRDMLIDQLTPAGGGMPAVGGADGASVMPVSGAATPTGAIAPEPTGAAPQGEQPMSTSDRIAGIDTELDRLTRFVGVPGSEGVADRISALEGQRERLVTQLEAEQTEAEAGSVEERRRNFLSPRIDSALDYLIQGTDEQGNPIFNQQVATRVGREASAFIQPQDYQEYVGNLRSIGNTYTFENLMRIRAAGALPGPISNVELDRISTLAGQLDPTDPRGTARTLQELRAEVRNAMRNAELREQGVLGMEQDASEIGMGEGQAPTTAGVATHRWNPETNEFEVIE